MTFRSVAPVKRFVSITFLACVIAATPMLRLFAALGPCSQTSPYQYSNTISCAGGACTGMIQIVPQQKACANTNSDNCTNLPNDLYITYMPKGVDRGWVTFVWCCEINSFCIACMAVFGTVCA